MNSGQQYFFWRVRTFQGVSNLSGLLGVARVYSARESASAAMTTFGLLIFMKRNEAYRFIWMNTFQLSIKLLSFLINMAMHPKIIHSYELRAKTPKSSIKVIETNKLALTVSQKRELYQLPSKNRHRNRRNNANIAH